VTTRVEQITRAAESQSLRAFRDFIGRTCQSWPGIGEPLLYDLKLAVDEACMNIITHGYAGMNPGSIILSVALSPQQVEIGITDFGHAFEPDEAPAPDPQAALEDRETGGFGLYFIYQTMDEVRYETGGGCNRLTLVKRL
jgi:serine/threonine-protein kinase RsbW